MRTAIRTTAGACAGVCREPTRGARPGRERYPLAPPARHRNGDRKRTAVIRRGPGSPPTRATTVPSCSSITCAPSPASTPAASADARSTTRRAPGCSTRTASARRTGSAPPVSATPRSVRARNGSPAPAAIRLTPARSSPASASAASATTSSSATSAATSAASAAPGPAISTVPRASASPSSAASRTAAPRVVGIGVVGRLFRPRRLLRGEPRVEHAAAHRVLLAAVGAPQPPLQHPPLLHPVGQQHQPELGPAAGAGQHVGQQDVHPASRGRGGSARTRAARRFFARMCE